MTNNINKKRIVKIYTNIDDSKDALKYEEEIQGILDNGYKVTHLTQSGSGAGSNNFRSHIQVLTIIFEKE